MEKSLPILIWRGEFSRMTLKTRVQEEGRLFFREKFLLRTEFVLGVEGYPVQLLGHIIALTDPKVWIMINFNA